MYPHNKVPSAALGYLLLGLLLSLPFRCWGAPPQASLYITRPPTPAEIARRNTHGRFEPAVGCYLGAFIDFDSTLHQPFRDQNRRVRQEPAGFEQITGKPHSMYFFYLGYGQPLPLDWVRRLGQEHKDVHIALEPNDGLAKVKNDAYLKKLAHDMAASGARIFLRFASEMNGDWTVYGKDPAEYRRKFRLVYTVMHAIAGNVALVWCPYESPESNIASFYPGDNATDWVGVNMYSVTFHNNSRNSPCEDEHPCDLLSFAYNHYAARKPFMICEFAATHRSAVDGQTRSDFAMRKILTLYAALPRIFPRVKCINYFDGNNLQFVRDRAYNDYSVTDDPLVIATYKYAISSPYFLSTQVQTGPPPPIPMPIRQGEPLRGVVRLSCWARSPSDFLTVRYRLDNYLIYQADRPDHWECLWNAGSVKPGKHTLKLEVLDPTGKLVAQTAVIVKTAL